MQQLIGPNGKPISSDQFRNKKSDPPKTGAAFGNWAGRDVTFASLPGGGVVQFDLSKLTITDFRTMLDHYQVNSSQAVLSFMQHQSDWHIECDDLKISNLVEGQIRERWTQLNRSMAQANWAGYSPNALEWENDISSRQLVLSKVKDLIPEECRVNWATVEGWAPPGRTPPKFKVFDGIQQFASGWPIPVDNCVSPETPILCSDFIWRKAEDLLPGDEIIAFDEEPTEIHHRGVQKGIRRLRKATIQVNNPVVRNSYEIGTDIGPDITASEDHGWLVWRGTRATNDPSGGGQRYRFVWVKTKDLQLGDQIAYFGAPWDRDESREAGWLAGMFDGEGCLSVSQRGDGDTVTLSVSQRESLTLDRLKKTLMERGFEFSLRSSVGIGNKICWSIWILGGRREIMRFIGMISPERFTERNLEFLFDGVMLKRNKTANFATVTYIEFVGEKTLAGIQTSTKTLITSGYYSHNSFWYPLLMQNGDYYGKKLLRPAFTSWFFSMLVHLFANRYYERFGEPTPIGRAPFDDELALDSESQPVRGVDYMMSVLQNLRNRGVVVLPNDVTQWGTGTSTQKVHYDYDVEYLESQMRGADFERYLTRLDEEISLAMFTPILLLRTADVGSYNLGVGHMQMYLWMLNAMNDDRAYYISKYICDPMVNYNFSPNAPRARMKFRKLGSANAEMLQALLVALINKDKAIPDLAELGQMAGMTIKQVRNTTKTSAAPGTADPNTPADPNAPASLLAVPFTDNYDFTEVNATVHEIMTRVRPQVERAFREHTLSSDTRISMGYKRKFEKAIEYAGIGNAVSVADSFFGRLDSWLADIVTLGESEFSGPDTFMAMFGRVIEVELERILANA